MKVVGALRGNGSRTDDRVMAVLALFPGGRPGLRTDPEPCDLLIQAGFQQNPALAAQMAANRPFLILENPVFGDKRGTFTIGFNGLHGLGWLPAPLDGYERPQPVIQPWREPPPDGAVYIYGQMNDDRALRGLDMDRWLVEMVGRLTRTHPGRQIVVRKHPKMFSAWEAGPPPLETTFDLTHQSYSWTSTAGLDAVLAGVPHTALHPGSLVYGAWGPGDERWTLARKLAWRQWSLSENPTALRHYLIAGYEQARTLAERGEYDDPGPMPARY